ncbi:MAG: radical SAM protein [Paludibacteraceae bacterium]
MFYSKIYYSFRLLQLISPPKRLWNGLKMMASYLFSKQGKMLSWEHRPLFISLEPSNVCNLHCPECPVGVRTEKVKPINMNADKSKILIDKLAPTLTHIIFYFQGEPFMNPTFLEIVSYARGRNILTSTSTNAQLITKERARHIVESGLDRLIISIDGTTQEIYEKYRVGGKLEKAIQAVNDIVEWKTALKKPHPFVEIQFIVMKHNEHQINEIKQITKKIKADKLVLKTAQIYDFEEGSEFIPTADKFSRYALTTNGAYQIKSPLKNSCKRLWSGSVVNSKGELLPCCFDKNADFSFGNVYDNGFDTVWQGNVARNFRASILNNRKQFEMCRNCTEK